jgi:hypothetical protein
MVLLKLLSLKSFPVNVSVGALVGIIIKVADSVSANNIPYNILFCIVSRLDKKAASENNRVMNSQSTFLG